MIIIILLSFCRLFSANARDAIFRRGNSSGLILMRRRSVFIEKQPYGASPLKSWLFAVIVSVVTSRLPCAYRSSDISSRCDFMSAHILSNVEAEMRWHVLSTCHVIGDHAEHTELSLDVPVVEPV